MGISNRGDDLQKLVETQQCEIAAAIDRNDDRVGYCQSVECGGSHGRRSVDDDDIEVSENRSQFAPEQQFTVHLLGFKKIVGLDVNGVGQQFQTEAWFDEEGADLGFVVDQEPMCGEFQLVEVSPESCG
jgi:hypothetical protein